MKGLCYQMNGFYDDADFKNMRSGVIKNIKKSTNSEIWNGRLKGSREFVNKNVDNLI